jgi:Thioesterase-like superfamily
MVVDRIATISQSTSDRAFNAHYVAVSDPLFTSDGQRFHPTEHTRGPWDPRAQHGGPPAALMARSIEALPADAPMSMARLTVEILRPIPLAPLTVAARIERPGRRVQLCSAVLSSGEVELCRASAWRIRRLETPLPEASAAAGETGIPPPQEGERHDPESEQPAFHRTGVELRFVRGSFFARGPSTVWIRLLHPVVDAEPPSPWMRVVCAADFGNGVSAVMDFRHGLFINTDLSVYLDREPDSDWICLDAQTLLGPHGRGLAESALHDEHGRIGRSLQTLLVEPAAAQTEPGDGFHP